MPSPNPKYEYNGLTCHCCGKTFNSKSRNKHQKYCSRGCKAKHSVSPTQFKSGEPSWNAGLNKSGMSGKIHSLETKEKMRQSSIGDKGSNWKGGVTDENYRVRRSGSYKAWRTAVFVRDGYVCQHCGAKSVKGDRVRLQADHIKPFAFYPDLRFDVGNGRTLCEPCHKKTPTYGNHKNFTGKQAIHEESGKTFPTIKAND